MEQDKDEGGGEGEEKEEEEEEEVEGGRMNKGKGKRRRSERKRRELMSSVYPSFYYEGSRKKLALSLCWTMAQDLQNSHFHHSRLTKSAPLFPAVAHSPPTLACLFSMTLS